MLCARIAPPRRLTPGGPYRLSSHRRQRHHFKHRTSRREVPAPTGVAQRVPKRRGRTSGHGVTVFGVGTEAIFLGGRSGVGKTTVALEMHAQLTANDVPHGVIDGDFLDMAHPLPWAHKLAEQNLAAIWHNYRALGYQRLIYINSASVLPDITDELIAAMGDSPTVCAALLTCSDAIAAQRLTQREQGSALDRHLRNSATTAALLADSVSDCVHVISTDQRPVADIAIQILATARWLPPIR